MTKKEKEYEYIYKLHIPHFQDTDEGVSTMLLTVGVYLRAGLGQGGA